MNYKRTTIKLQENLKKLAEKRAIDEDTTLQEIVNRALYRELFATTAQDSPITLTPNIRELARPIKIPDIPLNRKDIYDLE